jgi:hypothetical protein
MGQRRDRQRHSLRWGDRRSRQSRRRHRHRLRRRGVRSQGLPPRPHQPPPGGTGLVRHPPDRRRPDQPRHPRPLPAARVEDPRPAPGPRRRRPGRPGHAIGLLRASCRPLPTLAPARCGAGLPDAPTWLTTHTTAAGQTLPAVAHHTTCGSSGCTTTTGMPAHGCAGATATRCRPRRRGSTPRCPASALALTLGCFSSRSLIPSVFRAVWSCIRPGRKAPVHRVRPLSSVMTVAFLVFCFVFPETKAWRPGLFVCGRHRPGPAVPALVLALALRCRAGHELQDITRARGRAGWLPERAAVAGVTAGSWTDDTRSGAGADCTVPSRVSLPVYAPRSRRRGPLGDATSGTYRAR